MEKIKLLLTRIFKALLVVLAVLAINFALVRAAPGDPATILAGEAGATDASFIEQVRKDYGLDKPLLVQFGIYARQALVLDFGESYRENRPVKDLILERLPATLLLTLTALISSIIIGVSLGIAAARRADTWVDSLITAVSLIFFAMPLFWVGLIGILVFSVHLGWLPAYGMTTIGGNLSGWAAIKDIAIHLIMPATTLSLFYVAIYTRVMRASAIEVMEQDFVKTAHAKGVPELQIWRRHIFRNAILPVITFGSLQAGHLLGGSVLIETVFAWPGIGRLAFDALFQRDYNLLLAIFFVSSVIVVLINMLADVLYNLADPRIELQT